MPTYAVLGAGHGGLTVAGHLGLMGFPVRLWTRNARSIAGVAALGGLFLEGVEQGFGPVQACSEIGDALRGADAVIVVVPATAHGSIAAHCAPHLQDGQKILLLPGRTGGAIEFARQLRRTGCRADVLVGEAQTFLYASRRTGETSAHIFGIKRRVLAAALPAYRTQELLDAIRPAFPQIIPARWVWKTSLDNIGAIFHPAVTLMNVGWVETTGGAFRHYADGISPSVAALLERLDTERVAVAQALGVGALTAREWLADAYGVDRPTLYEAIQATPAYAGVSAPDTLQHRYIWEDVPTGLVPVAELGAACGVCTTTINTIIDLANTACRTDFRASGRTLDWLGMRGWSVDQMARYALEGDVIDRV